MIKYRGVMPPTELPFSADQVGSLLRLEPLLDGDDQ
jgi:hypothetical protein